MDQPRNTTNVHHRRKVQLREDRTENDEFNCEGFDEDDDRDPSQRRYGGQFGEARKREDDNLGSIKMKIPSFQGKNDPEGYLEWEKKVELVFDCHNCAEFKKVKHVAIELSDYAIIWCDQLLLNMRRNKEHLIKT